MRIDKVGKYTGICEGIKDENGVMHCIDNLPSNIEEAIVKVVVNELFSSTEEKAG